MVLWLVAVLLLLFPLSVPESSQHAPTTPAGQCIAESAHPIRVEIQLLDTPEPGRWLDAELRVESTVELENLTLHIDPSSELLTETGALTELGRLEAGEATLYRLQVRGIDSAAPQQLRLRLTGRHEGLELRRGAALHVLMKGAHQSSELSQLPGKHHQVKDHHGAARRLP